MPKARVTVVVEYDLVPEVYEGETNPEAMLKVDRENYESGDLELDFLMEGSVVDVTWEVVDA